MQESQRKSSTKPEDILFYVPNLIGYARLCLLIPAHLCVDNYPFWFLLLYGISISLDMIDGWSARKFGQCSAFGAWLDVIVDNVSRSMIWTSAFKAGWIVVCVEWTTFVCNHQTGSKWREDSVRGNSDDDQTPPKWILKVMENGFKTPLGTWVILGLHCLPMWVYALKHNLLSVFMSSSTSSMVGLFLASGRVVCLGCELWCVKKHIYELLRLDSKD